VHAAASVTFLVLALAALVGPFAAEAQPAGRPPRVGVISEGATTPSPTRGLRLGLRELGYIEGQNIVLEYRQADGRLDQVPRLAAELIAVGVDVLVVSGTVSAQAAKRVTSTIPIVFAMAGDPVGSRLVDSLARPGGNATGLSNSTAELSGKQLEILKAARPQVSRIGVLYNPTNPALRVALDGAHAAARALAVELLVVEVRESNEVTRALSLLKARRAGALLALSDPVIAIRLSEISKFAVQNQLPALFPARLGTDAGCLFGYGPSIDENFRRAASDVDKILKGATPASLPVQQPTKFEFVINMKTAKAMGLNLPQALLLQADEIIE
jgi:putative ABC transport system substrate-binding protein